MGRAPPGRGLQFTQPTIRPPDDDDKIALQFRVGFHNVRIIEALVGSAPESLDHPGETVSDLFHAGLVAVVQAASGVLACLGDEG